MNQPARKRSGLGRGLAALIPTGPAEDGTDALSPRIGANAADVLLGGGPTSTPSGPGAPAAPGPAPDGSEAVLASDVGATYREMVEAMRPILEEMCGRCADMIPLAVGCLQCVP